MNVKGNQLEPIFAVNHLINSDCNHCIDWEDCPDAFIGTCYMEED